jgi:hypothetical protein
MVFQQAHVPRRNEANKFAPGHILRDELTGFRYNRGIAVAHDSQYGKVDRGVSCRGIIGQHAQHPAGHDVGAGRGHEARNEVDLTGRFGSREP